MGLINFSPPSFAGSFGRGITFAEDETRILNCELHGGIYIGFASYMNHGFIRSYIEIGRYCSIGRNVILGSGAHNLEFFTTSPYFEKYLLNKQKSTLKLALYNPKRRVIIGNDVWIGDRAYIMSGVTVGHGSVIASSSVVTKNVPPYTIVAGTPAKAIKQRFSSELTNQLLDIKWWEYHPREIMLATQPLSERSKVTDFIESIRKNCITRFPVNYKKVVLSL
jgi:acetyltransferase-like isoleucine patch superfamily enzyme